MLPAITNAKACESSNLNAPSGRLNAYTYAFRHASTAHVKKILILFVVALAGCSTSKETAKSVAQCQLDADSPAGLAFRKSKIGADFDRYTKSYDYNLFMIKCMEAKGYSFPREGDANYEGCWSKKVDSAGVQNPNVDAPPCYTKS